MEWIGRVERWVGEEGRQGHVVSVDRDGVRIASDLEITVPVVDYNELSIIINEKLYSLCEIEESCTGS